MPYQDELQEGNTVSVWVGNLESEDAVIEYLGQPFERDFGFLLDEDDLPEIAGSITETRPSRRASTVPLQKLEMRGLFEALSISEDWLDEAEQSCRERGIDGAKVVIVFPHLRYRPNLCRNPHAPVQFIGSFPWPSGRGDWETRLRARVISRKELEGFTRIGFDFDCKWDPEHDLGVLTHKGRVVEVGQADTAFTDI